MSHDLFAKECTRARESVFGGGGGGGGGGEEMNDVVAREREDGASGAASIGTNRRRVCDQAVQSRWGGRTEPSSSSPHSPRRKR